MDFSAEIKQVQARKAASNDIVYKLVLETDNPMILDLGKLPSDTLFDVSVNLHNNSQNEQSEAKPYGDKI